MQISNLIRSYLSAAGLMFLTLFSFADEGNTPLFPIIGLFILFFALPFNYRRLLKPTRDEIYFVCLSILVLMSAMYGCTVYGGIHVKGALGILAGLLLFQRLCMSYSYHHLLQLLVIVLVFHITFFYIQLLYFLVSGEFIDYLSMLGDNYITRSVYTSEIAELQRFTGLYAEPAIYGYFVFLVVAVLLKARQEVSVPLPLYIIAIISMILTLSILSLFLSIILLLMLSFGERRFTRVCLLLALIAVFAYTITLIDSAIIDYVVERSLSPLNDPSGQARFRPDGSFFEVNDSLQFLLGIGVGNYNEFFVSNNYVAILRFFGLIGGGLFFIFLLMVVRFKFLIIFLVAVSLLQGYVITTLFWWFFLYAISRTVDKV